MNMRSILKRIPRRLRFFNRREDGMLTVEAIMILPLLIWWVFASYQFFMAFSERSANIKAAFTLADIVTRETSAIDPNYIEGLGTVFERLTNSGEATWIRVTQLSLSSKVGEEGIYLKDWSWATGGKLKYTNADLLRPEIKNRIPVMTPGDFVILVETHATLNRFFNVNMMGDNTADGLKGVDFDQFIIMRPRFLSKVACPSC